MEVIDIVLIIIIAGFAISGFWFGFVHTLGSLIGTIVGAYMASRLYEPMGDWFMNLTGASDNFARVLMFVFAFFVINRLVGFIFWLLDKMTRIFTNLPFIKSVNRFFGLLFGIFEGIITIGLIIYFIERFPLADWFMEQIAGSIIAPFATNISALLIPLLPDALKMLRSTVNYIEGIVL